MDLQKALNGQIIMIEFEKSEYENIRDENVRQLEEAKQFFDTLQYKAEAKIFFGLFSFYHYLMGLFLK